jgi:tetratricopeptide (TPR) repeat protein
LGIYGLFIGFFLLLVNRVPFGYAYVNHHLKKRRMIRYVLFFLLLTTRSLFAQMQEERVNMLQGKLRKATNEQERINLLGELSYAFLWTNTDSSIHYAQEQLSRSIKGGFRREQLFAYKNLSNSLSLQGVFQSSFQYMLQAKRIAEELGNDTLNNSIYAGMGALYSEMEHMEEAIPYLHKGIDLSQRLNDSVSICHNLVNLGISYEVSGQLDSALHYIQQAYAKALELGKWDYDMMGSIFLYTGLIHYKMGNKDIARAYYSKALSSAHFYSDWVDVTEIHKNIGNLFFDEGKTDSAKTHYELAMQAAERIRYNKAKVELAGKLTQLYKGSSKDSALKYLSLQMSLNDSLFNSQKTRSEQDMIFRERLYQEQQEITTARLSKERKANLQLLAISVFIIGFFSILLMLSRINIRPAYVEWMGIIALMMLFEFIALLIHPMIEKWTGHSPIYMLLILMGIAAIMGPLHHKVKDRVLSRLSRRS